MTSPEVPAALPPFEDRVITPVAARLLGCLATQVALWPELIRPRHVGLRPGAQAPIGISTSRDECCEGLAWVRLTGVVPSSTQNWPSADVVPQGGCGTLMLALNFEIGIVRCAPTPNASKMTSVEAWNMLSERAYLDYITMTRAICCFQAGTSRLTLVGAYAPLGVDGNCYGGTISFSVAALPCNCEDLESS